MCILSSSNLKGVFFVLLPLPSLLAQVCVYITICLCVSLLVFLFVSSLWSVFLFPFLSFCRCSMDSLSLFPLQLIHTKANCSQSWLIVNSSNISEILWLPSEKKIKRGGTALFGHQVQNNFFAIIKISFYKP